MNISLGPLSYLTHSALGYEKIIDEVERMVRTGVQKVNTSTYPPHNLIKLDDTHYIIEIAVAGFRQDEIDITYNSGSITISGARKEREQDANLVYIHRGIGTRNFTKTITLADTIEVRGATFDNGILTIGLENVVQDSNQPQKVSISRKGLDNFYPKLDKAAA